MRLDRRTLLVGTGAAGALVVAYLAWPRAGRPSLLPSAGERLLGSAIAIDKAGKVRIAIPQVETGQGIWTGLAQAAADALGAAWESVGIAPVRSGAEWVNGLAEGEGWRPLVGGDEGLRITAGSTSLRAFEQPMQQIGAAARALLVAEAAERWNVPAAACETSRGFVIHQDRRLSFGELAEAASRRSLGDAPAAVGRPSLIGQPLPRLDAIPKANGQLRFAGDVRLPDMLFASVRMSAGNGIRIEGNPPAGVRFASGDQWVAALADSWWTADRALGEARVRSFGPAGGDDAAVTDALDRALASGNSEVLHSVGDIDGVFEGVRPLAATYGASAALHHDLEPPSATARITDGLLELWAGTQAPELAQAAAARAGGVDPARTLLYAMPVGGQGGAALENDLVPIAAKLTRDTGRPVQAMVGRAEQVRSDAVRSPLKARLYARTLPDGSVAGLRLRLAGTDGLAKALGRLSGKDRGTFRASALNPLPYAIPNVSLEVAPTVLPVRTGYHRGEVHGAVAFFVESFIDELARIAGRDPLSQRVALLTGNPRLARCLVRATALGGWDGGGAGSQMGLSTISAYGSRIAVVANASVGTGGQVAVSRLVAVVDCGRAVNPALVRQQVEGGMLSAIQQATAPAPSFAHGRVTGPIAPSVGALAGTPEVLVEVLASDEAPGGVNGLGAIAAPAAVANALAAATGRRLRSLPLNPIA